jgi:hypothetical protein
MKTESYTTIIKKIALVQKKRSYLNNIEEKLQEQLSRKMQKGT